MHSDFWQEDKNHTFPDDPGAGIILNRHNQGAALDDVYVFSPSFLLNVRYGVEFGDFLERRSSRGFDLASLGFSPQLTGNISKSLATFPNVQVGSLTQLANWENGDGGTSPLTHHFAGTFPPLSGHHNPRFRGHFRVPPHNF